MIRAAAPEKTKFFSFTIFYEYAIISIDEANPENRTFFGSLPVVRENENESGKVR